MKVSKHGKTFEITGIVDAAVAARFLRQNGFTIVSESPDPRSPTLREADGDTCPSCLGTGTWANDDESPIVCEQCRGSGHV